MNKSSKISPKTLRFSFAGSLSLDLSRGHTQIMECLELFLRFRMSHSGILNTIYYFTQNFKSISEF